MEPFSRRIGSQLRARSSWAWFGGLGAVALAVCFVPLFDLLGYEFSALFGVLGGATGAKFGISAVTSARKDGEPRGVGAHFADGFVLGCLSLVAPLALISLNALRVPNCSFAQGLAFFASISLVSAVYGSATGVFAAVVTPTASCARLLWAGWIAFTVAAAIHAVIFEPPKFVYHALIGFFPGPIYDDDIRVTGTLVFSRAVALLGSAGLLLAAAAGHDAASHRFRFSLVLNRRAVLIPTIACGIAFAAVWFCRGPLGLRPGRRDVERVLACRIETEHLIVRFEPGSVVDRERETVAADAEFRYGQLSRFFEFEPRRKVGVYVYTTSAQKKQLVGAHRTDIADPINGDIHVDYREFPSPVVKHELAHVFAAEFHPWMELSTAVGLLEGVAIAAEWDDSHLTPHQWAKAMDQLGRMPDPARIMSPLGFWSQPSGRAYTVAGSFVRWLIETYGMDSFARAYPFAGFQRAYGKSLADLSREWRAFLASVPLTDAERAMAESRFSRPSVAQATCAHEIASLEEEAWRRYRSRDYAGARRVFERMAALDPSNATHRLRVLQTDIAAGKWQTVRDEARELLGDPSIDDPTRRTIREGMGDAAWRLDSLEEAREAFEQVAREDRSPEAIRRLGVKVAAMELAAESQALVQSYFDDDRAAVRLYRLREIVVREPAWALGPYLLGRSLFIEDQWEEAERWLSEAWGISLPEREFERETARLIGIARFRQGRFVDARQAFEMSRSLSDLEGDRLAMDDWIERCEWSQSRRAAQPLP
ncbi:hypothetical protein FJZ36_04295 [Candidatus Poribacteria bacterium]|nr:hypothetical protein [Candidatus Poribacteria bacterium]